MLVYRVFPHHPGAGPGEPGHPLYEHRPQRGGRVDDPDRYVWYLARHPEGAVGEVFGNLATWDPSMFAFPLIPGARRALGVYRLPDDLRILDLDDPAQLTALGLRPTQVVARSPAVTQAWGRRIHDEPDPATPGQPRWQAVQWWSYHHPTWPILASWTTPTLSEIQPLDLTHPAVHEAATALPRHLP